MTKTHRNVFFTKRTATLTSLNKTFTDLPKLAQRTGIQHLLRQWPYLTLRALPIDPSALQHPCNPQTAATTLRHVLTNVTDWDEPNNRLGAVYKIKFSDCQASYIGETGRNLNTRLTLVNTNEPREMVMLTIISLYIINWLTTTLTGTLPNA